MFPFAPSRDSFAPRRMGRRNVVLWSACVSFLLGGIATNAGEPEQTPPEYNRDVLPILAEHCFACHGPDKASRKGGLQLHRREQAIGVAITPGDAGDSPLMTRVTATEPDDLMPPPESGGRLSPEEIGTLRRWIAAGAEYQPHWAFVAPQRVEPPDVPDRFDHRGVDHPVDRFIRQRLEREGIRPAPPAKAAALIRRVSLDLVGLPPSPADVEGFVVAFERDPEVALGRLVDRLLASPYFGEKWARWWLDLAHYADSDGIRLDSPRPDAWRYRQWVVDALNDDQPFDQFTVEQLAGDRLPDATVSQKMATGLLRNTISDRQTGNADPELGRVRQIVDRTATFGTIWLGLTLGCAECHDHKFDPISQQEFYQLYAFFNNAEEANIDAPLPGEREAHEPARRLYQQERAALLAPHAEQLESLQARWEKKMLWIAENPGADHAWARAFELLVTTWGRGQGEGQFEGLMIIRTPPERRTSTQRERLQDYFLKNGRVVAPEVFAEQGLAELSKQLRARARRVPPLSRAQAMVKLPEPRSTWVHIGGDFRRPGKIVRAGTPAALPTLRAPKNQSSGQPGRLDLARWLVSAEHPLTTRVTVNRLWQELFGTGLVPSSDNFGMKGDRPSHPELLDWLACELPARDWSLKRMLRLLVTSQTYRQSSDARPDLDDRDPENRLLARQVKLRLSAEGVRDVTLAAGGVLHLAYGGSSVRPPQPESFIRENTRNVWKPDSGANRYRRGLYIFIQRLTPFVQLDQFDLPGAASACTRRTRSDTPLQALNLLNDPVFIESAQGLAGRVLREASPGEDYAARLRHAFLVALSRPPTAAEVERLSDYHHQQTRLFEADPAAAEALAPQPFPGISGPESAAWVMAASVLLNLHEFIHRE